MNTLNTPLSADIQKLPRNYLPRDFSVENWASLEPYFKELLNREINSKNDLEKWLLDYSELEAAISEDACWRQINMTRDTENKSLEEAFNYFVLHIQPHIQPCTDALNKKLIQSPFISGLDKSTYSAYLRTIQKNIDLFREENILLLAELGVLQQQFGQITGRMTIEHNGDEFTLQQAAKFFTARTARSGKPCIAKFMNAGTKTAKRLMICLINY